MILHTHMSAEVTLLPESPSNINFITRGRELLIFSPEANPRSAAEMDPRVTAMCSQARKVRSFAKKVLGSMRMGVVEASFPLGAIPRNFISAEGACRAARAAELPNPLMSSGLGISLRVGLSPRSGWFKSSSLLCRGEGFQGGEEGITKGG